MNCDYCGQDCQQYFGKDSTKFNDCVQAHVDCECFSPEEKTGFAIVWVGLIVFAVIAVIAAIAGCIACAVAYRRRRNRIANPEYHPQANYGYGYGNPPAYTTTYLTPTSPSQTQTPGTHDTVAAQAQSPAQV